jgi:uncharacterized protein (DUF2141 family)
MTRLLLALICATTSVLASPQQRDGVKVVSGSAQIAGTIVTADAASVPLRRAIVTLYDEGVTRLSAVTDDAGTFAFTSLPAGRYSLAVSKSGYVAMNYGSKRSGGAGTPVVVADGQRVAVAMALPRGSVITGTVRDEQGAPIAGVAVTALRYAVSFTTGERTLQSAGVGSSGLIQANYAVDAFPGTGTTDDRGVYRIYGLPSGEFVISAAVRSRTGSILTSTDVHQVSAADVQRAERLLREQAGSAASDARGAADRPDSSRVDYAPVYHPAAIDAAEAATITLGHSEERAGVDVLLRRVPAARVTGVVTAPDGSPVYNAQVSIMDPRNPSGGVLRATRSTEDGEFLIAGIAPGRYQMQASSYPDRLFGMWDISVNGRDISTSTTLRPGVTLSGRLVFDGTSRAPEFKDVLLMLSRHTFATVSPRFEIQPDGRFVFASIPPGTYKLIINGRPPAGWILRSAMANGVDVSDIAFEVDGSRNIEDVVITLTDRPAEISGRLQNADGNPAPDYVLVVFSADPRFHVARTRRTQQIRPDIDGRFIVRNLPAGDYFISAVTDIEPNQWNDPAFLATLAASSPIRIAVAEGDRKLQDIRIGGR